MAVTRYDEIINLPHHVSVKHPPMPMADRAAQFAPFAALTGYDAAIAEERRLTDQKISLTDEAIEALNLRYQILADALPERPEVEIAYFQPDERKHGGAYLTVVGVVKKLDAVEGLILLQDGTRIPMGDVFSIEGALFASLNE